MQENKRLQLALLNELASHMQACGFRTKVSGQSFYKDVTAVGPMPSCRYAFHLSFIKHELDFDVTADVAIRFHDLEDLINEYKSYLSSAEKRKTFSIGVELGNFSEGQPKRWTITSGHDIEPAASSIMNSFTSIGIPYFEKYSDLKLVLDILARDDKEARLHSPFLNERAIQAIGVAFLFGDREAFRRIALAKTALLSEQNHFGLQFFIKVKDALMARLESH